jgi:tetratricopeptide (TPR) repeat protein
VANNLASLLADYRTDDDSLKRAQSLAERLRQSPVPQFKDTVGWIDYRTGNYKDAVSLLEQAATALPNRANVHYHLGMAYIASGEPTKASAQLELALREATTDDLKKKIENALKGITGKG